MKRIYRGRRLRSSERMRDLVAETNLRPSDLIQPYFIVEGRGRREPIDSMPGIERLSVDEFTKEAKELERCGLDKVILFGVPAHKDGKASSAYAKDNIIEVATQEIKAACPNLLVIADVCLCAYHTHGHCGHVDALGNVDNDSTLETLSKVALSYARAGVDIVAPSDMMDGRVLAIREALDAQGFSQVPILSYAVKYASAFYGPFRDAAQSSPKSGDRKSYQMDFRNAKEALREVSADLHEGADMVLVKPALSYLDLIRDISRKYPVPVLAYSVSGEYSMVKAMAKLGWGDEKALALETLVSIKRAGASGIITYFAKNVQSWIG